MGPANGRDREGTRDERERGDARGSTGVARGPRRDRRAAAVCGGARGELVATEETRRC